MVRAAIDKNRVSVRTRLAAGLIPVSGDRVQLQQVVMNLILNSVEAMSSVEEGARELSICTKQGATRDILVVAVQDSGPGIDPEHLERVFAPFYTQRLRESEWDSRFAGPSLTIMGAGCGQRRLGLGVRYFSSPCRRATRSHEFSSDGLRGCRAERRQCSRWSSSTGLLR
jgi:histidine kinase/DNA gyrase B/HSP90-like ATPase